MAISIDSTSKKLFMGARLKRLRRERGLTQTRMAEDLGVSPSYLNLMERNQRPLTAPLLLRLAEAYDIDVKSFAGSEDQRAAAGLAEIFADPLFRDLTIPRHELVEVAESAPSVADAVARLYRHLLDLKRRAEMAQASSSSDRDEPPAPADPVAWVRDLVQEQHNHFAALDEAAEALAGELGVIGPDLFMALRERLREKHQVQIRVLPVDILPDCLRRFDRHRRQLHLSELMDGPGRLFAAAYQLAMLELKPVIEALVERSNAPDLSCRKLFHVNLINYAAAALMMPYQRFLSAAETLGYDITVLSARFGAGFEQVCHRLTTLSRPSARGVPFFMIRVDSAGNVSKRFAAGSFPFSRYGGTCPLWSLHATFKIPGKIFTEVVEMPDGTHYLSIARTVKRVTASFAEAEPELAVGLGCELKHASRLVYARGLDLDTPQATPIGINCRLCERPNCSQRAAPPLARALVIDEGVRGLSPFVFGG